MINDAEYFSQIPILQGKQLNFCSSYHYHSNIGVRRFKLQVEHFVFMGSLTGVVAQMEKSPFRIFNILIYNFPISINKFHSSKIKEINIT